MYNGLCLAFLAPNVYATTIHSVSAASAGAIATMATHPFDVIKVRERKFLPASSNVALDQDAGTLRGAIPWVHLNSPKNLAGKIQKLTMRCYDV